MWAHISSKALSAARSFSPPIAARCLNGSTSDTSVRPGEPSVGMMPRVIGAFDNTGGFDQIRAHGGNTGSMRCLLMRGAPQRSHTIRQGVFVDSEVLRAPLRDMAFGLFMGIAALCEVRSESLKRPTLTAPGTCVATPRRSNDLVGCEDDQEAEIGELQAVFTEAGSEDRPPQESRHLRQPGCGGKTRARGPVLQAALARVTRTAQRA